MKADVLLVRAVLTPTLRFDLFDSGGRYEECVLSRKDCSETKGDGI